MSAVVELSHNQPGPTPAAAPVVIIGTGPVGIRVAQEILRREPRCPLVLFGDEPWQPYNRVQLSALLAGEITWGELQNPLRIEDINHVVQHHNCAVVSIDRERRVVIDRKGREHSYGRLILAVGSRPHVPTIPGISQTGVFRFRDLTDMQALAARNIRSRRIVVLGGGLLGLEAARGLARSGTEVTVVEHANRVMPGQLDRAASDLLVAHLQKLGIRVILADAVKKVLGAGRVTGVLLRDAGTLECDTLVVAAGIRANTDLALGSGLRIGRGIVIDDNCLTTDPHIYAIGECAEHRGRLYGLVAPGLEQAAVVAHRVTGQDAQYTGSLAAAQLKVVKHSVYSVGDVSEDEHPLSQQVWVYRDPESGVYRKLVTQRRKLIGVIALGDWPELHRVQEAVEHGRVLMPWQLRRFARRGALWPDDAALGIHNWPDSAVVCNCTGVTRGTLTQALAGGCTQVEQLKQATGASSVCGSCRPLLAELVGTVPVAPDRAGLGALTGAGLAALLLCVALLLPAGWLVVDSVQHPLYALSQLWRDGFWKQVTGFSMLGLAVIGLLVSLRKRVTRVQWGKYAYWRGAHALLGALALPVLLLHTGLQYGERLNAWLLTNYLLLMLAGAVAGLATAHATTALSRTARRLQRGLGQAHLYIAWPLPVLLVFHILSVYYF